MDERELVEKLIATWENQLVELKKQKPSESRDWLISLVNQLLARAKASLAKLKR